MFIVLEGLDGAGKSTQIKNLENYFLQKQKTVRRIHFPRFDAPVYGGLIARFLRGELGSLNQVNPYLVALLFAGDRADAARNIQEALSNGEIVVADRYVYSNIAYQGAKMDTPEDRKMLRDWIVQTEFQEFAIPQPDVNIFLDVPLSFVREQLSAGRSGDDRNYLDGKRDIHEQDMYFQARVREVYMDLCRQDTLFHRVDCACETGDMAAGGVIFERLKKVLSRYEIS